MTRVQKHQHRPVKISERPDDDWVLWSCGASYGCLWLRSSRRYVGSPEGYAQFLQKLASSPKPVYPMLRAAKNANAKERSEPDAVSFRQSIPIP